MNILKTTITRSAEETTANGIFKLEYTVCNGVLERISVTIHKPSAGQGMPNEYLGTIVYEASAVNLNFINTGDDYSALVGDFERLLGEIRSSMAEENAAE